MSWQTLIAVSRTLTNTNTTLPLDQQTANETPPQGGECSILRDVPRPQREQCRRHGQRPATAGIQRLAFGLPRTGTPHHLPSTRGHPTGRDSARQYAISEAPSVTSRNAGTQPTTTPNHGSRPTRPTTSSNRRRTPSLNCSECNPPNGTSWPTISCSGNEPKRKKIKSHMLNGQRRNSSRPV